jgi:hypothetical protein
MTLILSLLARFWYVVPIVALTGAVWWLHEDNAVKAANLKAAALQVQTVTTANAGLAVAINAVKAQRIDNDAIATAVASKIGTNTVRETVTNNTIEKAVANDPKVAEWASTPVPIGVRQALSAP